MIEMSNGATSYIVDENNKAIIEDYKTKGFKIVEKEEKPKKVKTFGGE